MKILLYSKDYTFSSLCENAMQCENARLASIKHVMSLDGAKCETYI